VFLTHFHADFIAGHLELRDREQATIDLGHARSRKTHSQQWVTAMSYGWGECARSCSRRQALPGLDIDPRV
jgi:glyoxylase-like metal-dependent hydrolase (beta-lactamase superfamily II)